MSERYVLVALVLVSAGLAGCIGSSSQSDLPYASFEEAKGADGKVVEPVQSDSSVRLKLLEPSADGAETGKTDVVFLLYDGDSPVTDAEATLEARMPAMGHGTSPEEDPTHRSDGMYVGMTNLMMGGTWVLNVNVTLAEGTTLEFDVEVVVGDGGMAMGGNRSKPASFDSFQQALDADGTEFPPDSGFRVETTTGGDSDVVALPADPVYTNSIPFAVNRSQGTTVEVSATLSPGSDADNLTFTVVDADGSSKGELVLDAQTTSGSLNVTDVGSTGDWSVDVSGRAVQASYDVEIAVRYPAAGSVVLKMLGPASPDGVEQDKQPFVVLLYDKQAEEPITDAAMTLASYMPAMGHGTEGEVDPAHQGDGIYKGKTNLIMGGTWQINVTATREDAQFEWTIEATV